MNESIHRNALTLQEIVKAEIYRSRPDGSYGEPEPLCVDDLITTAGRTYIAQRIASGDTVASAMAHMAVGSGATAAVVGDTALVYEVKRKALAISSAGAEGSAANVYTAVATFGGAADTITSAQIQEAGIFNHAASGQGTMMQRVTFSTVTLADSDLLKITLQTNCGSS